MSRIARSAAPAIMILAAVGFLASLITHVAARLAGWAAPKPVIAVLHIGAIAITFVTIPLTRMLSADYPQRELWTATFRGCPSWMRIALKIFFAYGICNFILFMILAPHHGNAATGLLGWGFSGHWMIFYSVAFATAWSARSVLVADPHRRCPMGHPVSSSAQFCERCGERVAKF